MSGHFAGDTLFDKIARVVCSASCLPRKELYESWELARRVRRRFRGGRVVDLASGHGLLAHLMLILDATSASALAVDPVLPKSATKLAAALADAWPRLADRVSFEARPLEEVRLTAEDVVVSAHACGALTDLILERAISARARVAVLPCCQHLVSGATGGLEGWLDGPLAIDVRRAARLAERGYRVHTATIPVEITPKNRVLFGAPPSYADSAAASEDGSIAARSGSEA